ncbi:DUF3891 family protein [Neobacillus rhizophilus]|uniref:DUF3891 family protein n=1 Tax=Neobacillus rhizophilus TaxID=2833579 RepID=A0A942YYP6_9BACI|nr:DUF3891 family protein [Neobacillus rhizophilus]MBS4215221.1 DUF3891 family protein [Neobacillus rhizophilus]
MIIYEQEDSFIMIKQDDHARISGIFAQSWKNDYFYGMDLKDEVVLAISEHDRGWIEADEWPLWNDEKDKPYSFIDHPMTLKTAIYKKGIDEVELMSKYASLLCSLHFVSFLQNEVHPLATEFVTDERKRLQFLFKDLGIKGNKDMENLFMYHLKILKFCDNLSLYICLNEPGVEKADEHPFFRNGFPEAFSFANDQPIHAHWTDRETVELSLSPLSKQLQVYLPFKEVNKEEIMLNGLLKAYAETQETIRKVTF